MSRSQFELADVIHKFGKEYIEREKPSAEKMKVLFDILRCRTAALGGHKEQCDCCGEVRYSYNSCGNRHCPKCLSSKQIRWIEKLQENTLPIKHYHLVFTLPHQLNKICLFDKRLYYSLLFRAVWETLRSFGYTHFGCETGAVAVLHTWGQNLSLHPHVHCLVPAAGVALDGRWKKIESYENFLYPTNQLRNAFKGKFLDSLKRALKKKGDYNAFKGDIEQSWNKKWVVHCEPSMASGDHVIRYLGQYTHRVAISNNRIEHISDTHVTFWSKDYRDNATQKLVPLKGVEFLRRFCQHILPKRFVKIRYFGIYNHTTKQNLQLKFVKEQTEVEKQLDQIEKGDVVTETLTPCFDRTVCQKCKNGRMHVIEEIPRIRSPPRLHAEPVL